MTRQEHIRAVAEAMFLDDRTRGLAQFSSKGPATWDDVIDRDRYLRRAEVAYETMQDRGLLREEAAP